MKKRCAASCQNQLTVKEQGCNVQGNTTGKYGKGKQSFGIPGVLLCSFSLVHLRILPQL